MIGFLRFAGVANAAVWFGTAVFYTLSVASALSSADVILVLGEKNFPFFGGAISQVLLARYFQVHLICAVIALLHLLAEWLYLGRAPRKIWTGLVLGLFWVSLLGNLWLGPKLRDLHKARHYVSAPPAQREAAARTFRLWSHVYDGLNVFMLGGVGVWLWRTTHPPDELRFVVSPKFRG